MTSRIDARINRIADALPVIVNRLGDLGFSFYHPERVLPGPEPNTAESIARIESEIGAVPYAVAGFWRQVGSVDLTGTHDEWYGCEYPDSLVVLAASDAIGELDDFLADREERLAADEDVRGGMWYSVDCPANDDNPIVNDERHKATFLDYLDLAIYWGGFPGLDNADHHNWPIETLSTGLRNVG
jgi:hypothetical protein